MTEQLKALLEFADAYRGIPKGYICQDKAREALEAGLKNLIAERDILKDANNKLDEMVNSLAKDYASLKADLLEVEAERDEYQQCADKMAAEHKVERDELKEEVSRHANNGAEFAELKAKLAALESQKRGD